MLISQKKYYEANKDVNEGYLKYLDEVDEDTFINYLFSLLETNRQVDWNYIKLTSKRLTPMERKSIYYRNNIPAVFGQEIWNGFMSKILDLEVNSKDEEELKIVLGEFGDLIFHTTAIDFIRPERFTRPFLFVFNLKMFQKRIRHEYLGPLRYYKVHDFDLIFL